MNVSYSLNYTQSEVRVAWGAATPASKLNPHEYNIPPCPTQFYSKIRNPLQSPFINLALIYSKAPPTPPFSPIYSLLLPPTPSNPLGSVPFIALTVFKSTHDKQNRSNELPKISPISISPANDSSGNEENDGNGPIQKWILTPRAV